MIGPRPYEFQAVHASGEFQSAGTVTARTAAGALRQVAEIAYLPGHQAEQARALREQSTLTVRREGDDPRSARATRPPVKRSTLTYLPDRDALITVTLTAAEVDALRERRVDWMADAPRSQGYTPLDIHDSFTSVIRRLRERSGGGPVTMSVREASALLSGTLDHLQDSDEGYIPASIRRASSDAEHKLREEIEHAPRELHLAA